MARTLELPRRLLARLRPSPDRVAAAAALQDPSLLLRLEAEQDHAAPPPPRRDHGVAASIRAAQTAETGGALLLVGAVVVALLWSNSPWHSSYFAFWQQPIGLTVGPWTLAADLRTWIDEGLMTLFFLVVGLEAKRERDLGELREGRRLTVPVLAAVAGIVLSATVYLAVASGAGAGGWGVAISTDTALALGALTLAAGRNGDRLRVFMLTLLVVDDVAALLVISLVYPGRIHLAAVIVAAALLALLLSMRTIAGRQFRARGTSHALLTPLSMLTGVALWLALFLSGFDPVVSGLFIGLLTNAYEPRPKGPAAISPNDRLQHQLHPLTSKVVVPVFALANAGLTIDRDLLASAVRSPITWGIVVAFLVGKPLGILGAAWVASRGTVGRAMLSLEPRELGGVALSAGVGFTVSLLIASRAFDGAQLDQAKVAILVTALVAPALAVASLRATRRTVRARPRTACLA